MQRFRGRILKVMIAGGLALVLGLPAGVAAATSAPRHSVATGLSIRVSPPKGSPGSLVTVSGSGFLCASAVDILWQYTKGDPVVREYIGSTSVTRGGGFTVAVHVPDATSGPSTIMARGSSSGSCQASIPFSICSCDVGGYRREG